MAFWPIVLCRPHIDFGYKSRLSYLKVIIDIPSPGKSDDRFWEYMDWYTFDQRASLLPALEQIDVLFKDESMMQNFVGSRIVKLPRLCSKLSEDKITARLGSDSDFMDIQ